MTSTENLLALAARCEAGTGPDRALDAAIVVALTPECIGIERPPLDGLIDSPNAEWLLQWSPPRPWSRSWRPVPAYTASLDAAASLVPAGWVWSCYGGDRDEGCTAYCVPNKGKTPWPAWVDDVVAPTPARALTAAALRAIAAEAGNER